LKKKIILAIPALESMGGEEKMVFKIAVKLSSLGRKVEIVTGNYFAFRTYPFRSNTIISGQIMPGNFILRRAKMIKYFSNYEAYNYDYIIAFGFPSTLLARHNKNVIWYCNTPPKSIYEINNYVRGAMLPLAKLCANILKKIDKRNIKSIKTIIANSMNIHDRIWSYYDRSSKIIYPGVDIPKSSNPKFKKQLLSVGRLYKEKRIDIIVEAMILLPKYKLHVVGDGPELGNLKGICKEHKLDNVIFLGQIDEKRLNKLYDECFAAISIPVNEDFGLIPVEANAHGKMCIGVEEGGMKETIIHGDTGIFLEEVSGKGIADAVKAIEIMNPNTNKRACKSHAKKFSWKRFHKELKW